MKLLRAGKRGRRQAASKLNRRKLAAILVGFFVALLIPAAVLVSMALDQLKWQVFHRHHTLARELVERLDGRLALAVRNEDLRSLDSYRFSNPGRRSLSALPVNSAIPGVIGYFQVGPRGEFSTPLLPSTGNFAPEDKARVLASLDDLEQRTELSTRIFDILSRNQLVRNTRFEASAATVITEIDPSDSASSLSPSTMADDEASGVASERDLLSASEQEELESKVQAKSLREAPREPRRERESAAKDTTDMRHFELARPPRAIAEEQAQANFDQLRSPRARQKKLDQKQTSKLGRVEDIILNQPYQRRIRAQERAEIEVDAFESTAEQSVAAGGLELAPQEGANDVAAKSGQLNIDANSPAATGLTTTRTDTDQDAIEPVGKTAAAAPGAAASAPSATTRANVASVVQNQFKSELLDRAARVLRGPQSNATLDAAGVESERITTFEHESEPSALAMLGDGQLVLFRNAWRSGQRFIQGALFDWKRFVEQSIETEFRRSPLAAVSRLAVAYEGEVRGAFDSQGARSRYIQDSRQLSGTLLYRARLSGAFSDLELVFTITALPLGSSALVVLSGAAVLGLVLFGGCAMMYRLGAKQIELRQQQQDFVSAVSHELRTPLTSIRMYGELLREGWASEERKRDYYKFIHDESERLSRLIDNVLQLARMERNDLRPHLTAHRVAELDDHLRSKVAAIADSNEFKLKVELSDDVANVNVLVDLDFFSQIVINLADNAVKFSASAAQREIVLAWRARASWRSRVGRCVIGARLRSRYRPRSDQ